MNLEFWDDALGSFISLGVLALFVVLLAFIAGILPMLENREQKVAAGLLALVMASASVWGLTEYELLPQAALGLFLWLFVVWGVVRAYKDRQEPP